MNETLSVPVIDLTAPGGDLYNACRDWGFFQVINHGISAALIDRVWAETRSFFLLPEPDKANIRRSRDNPWGWYDRELTKNRQDQKEVFDFTVETATGSTPFTGANRWPAGRDDFRQAMLDWFSAMERLSSRLLSSLSTQLGVESGRLQEAHGKPHTSFTRLNYYPLTKKPGDDGLPLLGIHPHADAGSITLLLQDDVPGLEVYRDGRWFPVHPRRDALVINIGDMLQVWTNDRFKAPLHRVLPSRDRERFSIPFFFNPAYNAQIAPLPELLTTEQAAYQPFTWGEFRRRRADGDFADYGSEVQINDYRIA
ncbi:MAG: 2OG-Fe(II) oxygenase family protein [Pseudomonadota bacterium]